jgi:nucleotide-binding universal stress UspA family protein
MATATITRPRQATRQRASELSARPPLLVATDGTRSADAAICAAHAIAARTKQRVTMIAVNSPIPMIAAEVQIATSPRIEEESCATLRTQVESQLQRLRIGGAWPLDVVTGDPAATIARMAQSMGAALVIMGVGGHGLVDRIIGDELVLHVLRLGTVPVLAVAPTFVGLPNQAVAAVDFSKSSVRALRCAMDVLATNGIVTAAHIVSRDLDPVSWTGTDAPYHGTIGRAFDRIAGEVAGPDTVSLDRRVLPGDPAREVLALAKQTGAQLIVAGSHGHNFLTRLMLGSVSTRLIRGATCSVLVAPPDDSPDFIEELPASTKAFGFYEWAERLEEFTRRNAGRRAMVEVIDPEIGAQLEERDMVFAGASFDPRDARVQLMFGGVEDGGRHLTRSIGGVTAIQALRDRTGNDLLLRVASGRGQTLVTLSR